MAYEVFDGSVSLEAGADLSANQFYAVKVTGADTVGLAGDDELMVGVLQNKPAAAGRAATVRISGLTKAVASAAIAAGAKVGVAAGGKFKTADTGSVVCGTAVNAAGADGEVFTLALGVGVGDVSA